MAHKLLSKGLKKAYKGKAAVKGLDISVKTGEIVGLLGPNGAGKTTTFYMIVGMVKADSGEIFLDDTDISGLPMYQRARMGISYLPQEPSIFRRLTVRDNIRAILEIKGYNKTEIEEELLRLLEEFQLRDFSGRKGIHLSGGERRRTEIARTLATKPTFILFDEPFAGIDPIAILELKNTLRYLKDMGIGILLTDHNVRDTLSITDRAYIISDGAVLDEGEPEKLINNPEVRSAYLGEEFTL
ncbi:lipopolysaccharide export system ATP-binding protein LptB [bacterium BMS3Bbin07]|nr:lipopolysaccharide export system ATP-binding protein LptB [bacterium BMS3Bbin07]HDH01880.1 LPS export ABC transporter ATP-binding protein [Nitrospirota bacterium]